MEEQFRPKERVGGSSPSRGTVTLASSSATMIDCLFPSVIMMVINSHNDGTKRSYSHVVRSSKPRRARARSIGAPGRPEKRHETPAQRASALAGLAPKTVFRAEHPG